MPINRRVDRKKRFVPVLRGCVLYTTNRVKRFFSVQEREKADFPCPDIRLTAHRGRKHRPGENTPVTAFWVTGWAGVGMGMTEGIRILIRKPVLSGWRHSVECEPDSS